jgi:hypothetical protein
MTSVSQTFIINGRVALEIQKSRISIGNRIYSYLIESQIRSHPNYPQLLAMRRDKNADRTKTAAYVKKLLKESLEAKGITEDEIDRLYNQNLKENKGYIAIEKAESEAFKVMKPMLEAHSLWPWIEQVKGLGLRNGVKLLIAIRDIERFENPSKLRTYCGCAPGMRKVAGAEANFNPELKGLILGQIADSFIKSGSQYKKVYDDKKAYYLRLHPEAEQERPKGKKLTKEDWTKMKIHRYAIKAMMNRFLVDFWCAWYESEGKQPPVNPWILNEPHHNREPMIVPFRPAGKVRQE